MSKETRSKVVQVRLTPSELAELDRLCEFRETTRSKLLAHGVQQITRNPLAWIKESWNCWP